MNDEAPIPPLLFARKIAREIGLPMADPFNEKPTLKSILDDYGMAALEVLPNPCLVESLVMVRTTDISNMYAYSLVTKFRAFSLDERIANVRTIEALEAFRNVIELEIQERKKLLK